MEETSEILLGMAELLSRQSVKTIKKVWDGWQEILDGNPDLRKIMEMVVQSVLRGKEEEIVI